MKILFFTLFAICLALFTPIQSFAEESEIWDYEVATSRLDNSRNKLSTKTGGSSFSFSEKDIENLPQGQVSSMNQLLLRAPNVVQNSYGQIHLRGDHSHLQYRINGVMLPEGISGFGQVLDVHFIDRVDLLTGAMPAQFGFQNAGVIDIKTKDGAFKKGGRSELTLGGNDTFGFNQQIGGSDGKLNYFLNASHLQNNRGIEPPTAARNPIHDDTSQQNLFGYFSYLLDATTRLNLIIGSSQNHFQVPNNPNQSPSYSLSSGENVSSSNLNEKQSEMNNFLIASLQGISSLDIDYQISAFSRYSDLKFRSDYVGGLTYNGIASDIDRNSFVNGLQGDFSYELNEKNIFRSGFFISDDATQNDYNSFVFSADDEGNQTSTDPINIINTSKKHSQLYGIYLQDELKLLKKLTLNFGARFDGYSSYNSENQISPRIGAIYDLNEKTKIHAGFARYFTPPPTALLSNSDLSKFENTTNASNSLVNDQVKAERTSYYDIGIAHKMTKYLSLGLDTYYKQIRNLLDLGQFGNALIYTPFNYQRGEAYGVEFSADYQRENFASYLNLAAQNARAKNIISGQYLFDAEELSYIKNHYVNLDHSQYYTASAGASYSVGKTKYSADAIFGSGLRTGDNNSNTMPSYLQINGSVAHDFELPLIERFNARLAAINIFDEVYQLHNGSGIGVAASQYGPRRTFYLVLSKNF